MCLTEHPVRLEVTGPVSELRERALQSCHDADPGHFAVQLPRAEPLMAAGGSHVDFGVFDCRPLHDPAGRHHRMHLGAHPANFHGIVYHQFRDVIRPAALKLKEAMRQAAAGRAAATLVFMRKSGR